MNMAHEALKKSNCQPQTHGRVQRWRSRRPHHNSRSQDIVKDKITISTVMIGGHVAPDTMTWMADHRARPFLRRRSPKHLPQIFIKEAAVILKSAIFEEPFKPQDCCRQRIDSRDRRRRDARNCSAMLATTPKARAEMPLVIRQRRPDSGALAIRPRTRRRLHVRRQSEVGATIG